MEATRHPLMMVAAGAVTLFSLTGIGAMLGWIPTSTGSQSAPTSVAQVAEAPAPQAAAPVQEQPAPVVHRAKPRPKPVAKVEPPVQMAAAIPPPPPPAVAVAPICSECGVIESVREITKQGQGSGAGAVGGAVVGGVLGHQVGNGRGRELATVLGLIGGGLAGNQVEKSVKTSKEYRITVRFEDGTTRLYPSATAPAWHTGDKVRVVNGEIRANS